jgi:hypothetical protein
MSLNCKNKWKPGSCSSGDSVHIVGSKMSEILFKEPQDPVHFQGQKSHVWPDEYG